MDAMKGLIPIGKWLLRLAAVAIVYLRYFDMALGFSFNSVEYFLALGLVLSVALLLIGGFMKTNSGTVVSGLMVCLLAVIAVFVAGFSLDGLLQQLPLAALGFYFMARGNS